MDSASSNARQARRSVAETLVADANHAQRPGSRMLVPELSREALRLRAVVIACGRPSASCTQAISTRRPQFAAPVRDLLEPRQCGVEFCEGLREGGRTSLLL